MNSSQIEEQNEFDFNHFVTENRIELSGLSALNPFARNTHCSRTQMQASASSQHLTISGAEPNAILSGAEQEYGKGTYSIKAEHDITNVIAIVDRYTPTKLNGIKHNPQRVVIYQTNDDSPDGRPVFGIIDIPRYCHKQNSFGFNYKRFEGADSLIRGQSIPKGTILYDSPAKDQLGNYSMGLNLNAVYVSTPDVIEDSILIDKEVLHRMTSSRFTEREGEFGENAFPINSYGDDNYYGVFPEIGQYVSPKTGYNGMILATRPYMMDKLPIMFTQAATQKFDPLIDTALDSGGPDGQVVDIIVYRNGRGSSPLKSHMTEQLEKYEKAYVEFCSRILKVYSEITRAHGFNPNVTDEFNALLKHCMAITNKPIPVAKGKNANIQKVGNFSRKLDDWYVKVIVEHKVVPNLGHKVTDLHG